MTNIKFTYFFDPLCGWCYASAPALAGIAERYGEALRMMPVGLFFAPRPVSTIADHAWRNDQRIAALTGQVVSEPYHRDVLQAQDGVFSSAALTTALCALGEIDPRLEQRFLHAAQIARYVEGLDTSRVDEVLKVVAAFMAKTPGFNAAAFAEQLRNDQALAARVQARMAAAQSEMQALPETGVPQLILHLGDRDHVISGQPLYQGAVLSVVQQLAVAA